MADQRLAELVDAEGEGYDRGRTVGDRAQAAGRRGGDLVKDARRGGCRRRQDDGFGMEALTVIQENGDASTATLPFHPYHPRLAPDLDR